MRRTQDENATVLVPNRSWYKVSAEETKPRIRSGKEKGRYANFFQIGHNAFEFLIEFGQQDAGIHTRIYVSPHHARMLSELLEDTLREHEAFLGPS